MTQAGIQFSSKHRHRKELTDAVWRTVFGICGVISAIMIVLIFVFVCFRGVQVFLPGYKAGQVQNIGRFLTGMQWRQDQGAYGVAFIVINTVYTAVLAGLISFPVSVLSALFIVKIAPRRLRQFFTTIVELLAAIPSVVYGVFAAGSITALVSRIAGWFGYQTAGGISGLAVVLLLAIMIYPTITELSISAIEAVPVEMEQASLALGASQAQTNFKVVLRTARSGIFAGLVLGLGRAFGEATAVSMVAGNAMLGPTWNLFMPTRTLTSTMLAGMHETAGLDYDIRFSVGIVLMIVITVVNGFVNWVKRKVGGSEE